MTSLRIRDASPDDAEAVGEIYAPYVLSSNATFELEPPATEELKNRIARSLESWAWLIGEIDGTAIGYAYAGPHRERAAYRQSVETSIYLHPNATGKKVGFQLYSALIARIRSLPYANAYAGISLPNAASVRLHTRLGFRLIGVFPRIGWKFSQWHDVAWWHLSLADE